MSSRLASSSKSPPRRVTMPALPLAGKLARSAPATPPKPSTMGGNDENGLEIAQTDSDARKASSTSSPAINTSPKAVDPAKMEPAKEDDVFGSPTSTGSAKVIVPVGPAQDVVAAQIEGDFHAQLAYKGFVPRPDRVSQLPNALNAQGLYPPDALIFVANLSNQRSVDQLEKSCHETFDGYGRCHIKVKFDKNRHPFAFVQFEQVDHANTAANATSEMMIDGRKIRIERAKAERAVILSRNDGAMVSEAEAYRLLGKYGPIEMCVPTNTVNRTRYNMTQGMYIKFAYYLDCRDALRSFNNHAGVYKLYMAPALEPRIRAGPTGSPVVRGFSTPRSAVDQKSIYVGNLTEETTRQELEDLFKEYGTIVQANVIKKSFAENSINVFGFVEFSNPHDAERASLAERSLRGVKLRVEPKEYSARRPQRTAYFPGTPVRQDTPQNYVEPGYGVQPMNYNNPDMYAMQQQMTTPPGGYNQGYPMPVFNPHPAGVFSTPPGPPAMGPVAPMGPMGPMVPMVPVGPMGMFPPSPARAMDPYYQGFDYQYSSPMYSGHAHMMGPIQEQAEEEHY